MNLENNSEGSNLKKLLLEKYGTLQIAADSLDLDYTYLTRQCKKDKLNPKYKAKIAQLLGVQLAVIETGNEPQESQSIAPAKTDWQTEALATLRKLEELQAKYIRLLEELRNGRK